MKTCILALFVVAGLATSVRAQNSLPEFSARKIESPALSLLGAADQAIADRVSEALTRNIEALRPRAATRMRSRMPILKPREGIDDRLVKAPDASRDFKMRVITPELDSSK